MVAVPGETFILSVTVTWELADLLESDALVAEIVIPAGLGTRGGAV
jgi:hypothetical protein